MTLELVKVNKKNQIQDINLKLSDGSFSEILSTDYEKTSLLLKMIIGLSRKSDGKILLFNHDQQISLNKAKNFIGYTNGLRFKGNPTVSKYLDHSSSFYKADYSDNINRYLDEFNINKEKKVKDLNDYEKINLAIINIIFFDPKLILLDNILDKMDDASKIKLNNILYELKRNGTSVLSASYKSNLTNTDNIYTFVDGILTPNNNLINYYLVAYNADGNNLVDLNVISYKESNNLISYIYKGDIASHLKKLTAKNIKNIKIDRPSIEDIKNEI